MLNISKSIYICWSSTANQSNGLPESEVVPIGNSTNEKLKIKSTQSRLDSSSEHDNVPLPGFTLLKSNRRRYGSSDETWLVIDPRGFLVRITNDNLENIFHTTGITEGLIQERCVWARENTNTTMILVPISSPLYKEAIDNTELLDTKIKLKDVQIGDTVLLQNKLTGRYLGTHNLYSDSRTASGEIQVAEYKKRQILEIAPNKYYYLVDLKILKVVQKSEKLISKEEIIAELNSNINNGIAYFSSFDINVNSSSYFSARDVIKYVSSTTAEVKYKITEVSKDDFINIYHLSKKYSDLADLIAETNDGHKCLIEYPYLRNGSHTLDAISCIKINITLDSVISIVQRRSTGRYYNCGMEYDRFASKLDNFVKFYKIVKCVKNETYF